VVGDGAAAWWRWWRWWQSCGALNGVRNGSDRGQPIGSDFGLTLLPERQSRLQGAAGGQQMKIQEGIIVLLLPVAGPILHMSRRDCVSMNSCFCPRLTRILDEP